MPGSSAREPVPLSPARVNDDTCNGKLCTTTESQQQRWSRHFTNVLNIQAKFDMEEPGGVRQRRLRPENGEPPSKKVLSNAVGMLKNGKVDGESGYSQE